jgi:hypothetical protein
MTFDLSRILASKQRYRARLAAQPIADKLRMLDALRERTVALRRAATAVHGQGDPRINPAPRDPARDDADPITPSAR